MNDSKTKNFEKWFSNIGKNEIYTLPSQTQKENPCKTKFFFVFYWKHFRNSIQLETFYLNYFSLYDDTKSEKLNKSFLSSFREKLKSQIEIFQGELNKVDKKKLKKQQGKLNLLKFKELRHLTKQHSNSIAHYNYELIESETKENKKKISKMSKDGFDSLKFVKLLKKNSLIEFTKKIDKTISLMRIQGLMSLYMQLKSKPRMDPDDSAFLAPYKRYLKYKKVNIFLEIV